MDNLPWFKLYAQDWLIDPNISSLSSEDRVCYITMMCMAHLSKKRGTIPDFSEEKIIRESKFKTREEADRAVGFSERMGKMLRRHGTSVSLPNFKRRQESQLSAYERVKKHREGMKRNDNADDTRKITLDIDKEEDRDKENKIPFIEFWNPYPKKVEKKKAEEKWNRLSRATQKAILKDLPLRKQTESWRRGFILNPMTYLNGERWNDELQGLAAPPQKKICVSCKKDASGGWVQTSGGVMCTECNNLPRSSKYRELAAGFQIKSIPKP